MTADDDLGAAADAVLWAARALVGITAASVAAVEETVSLPQLRVLVLLHTRGPMKLATLATAANVNPSNASRACDRLIAAGLLVRDSGAEDRRTVTLQPTEDGHALVGRVFAHRRAAVENVLRGMDPGDWAVLAHGLGQFAAAAGEPIDTDAMGMLWPTRTP